MGVEHCTHEQALFTWLAHSADRNFWIESLPGDRVKLALCEVEPGRAGRKVVVYHKVDVTKAGKVRNEYDLGKLIIKGLDSWQKQFGNLV